MSENIYLTCSYLFKIRYNGSSGSYHGGRKCTGCPKKNDTVTLSHNFRLNYPNSKFRLSSSEDMSDYVTEFWIWIIQSKVMTQSYGVVLFGTPCSVYMEVIPYKISILVVLRYHVATTTIGMNRKHYNPSSKSVKIFLFVYTFIQI